MKAMKTLAFCSALLTAAAAVPVSPVTVFAEETPTSGVCGENLIWNFDTASGTITISGKGAMDNIEYADLAPWADKRDLIKAVVFEDGITAVGDYAFAFCENLQSVTFADSITDIRKSAFRQCYPLENFTLPPHLTVLGSSAFSFCKEITGVTIPDGVTKIGSAAFEGCEKLETVDIPESVTEIGGWAFYVTPWQKAKIAEDPLVIVNHMVIDGMKCKGDVIIPADVTAISAQAFYTAMNLGDLTILNPDCAIYMNRNTVINHWDEVTSEYSYTGTIRGYDGSTAQAYAEKYGYTFEPLDAIPEPQEGMTWALSDDGTLTISGSGSMGEYGWADELPWYERAAEIKKAVIENGITDIADYAFYDCENLADVSIPTSVTTIGESAFEMCSSLKSVSLPAGITEMKMYAFANSGITSVSIPAGVGTLESCIFQSCAGLTSVVIPEKITRIKNDAFYSCENLAEITIPATVKSIGGNAFTGTAWLAARQKENPCVTVNGILIDGKACTESVTVPAGITEIADDAFRGSGITGIVIPEGVTRIGARAFSGIKPLAEITIPASVTEIGEEAFLKTAWLTAMQTANPLVIVNHIVIDGTACTGDVTIPADVTFIENSAFYRATGLTSIVIPEGVPAIGNHTFDCCDNLAAVTLPESITYIGEHAFDFCDKLKEVTVPASTKSIDYAAFRGCRNLSAFTILNPDCEIWDENTTICNHNEGEGPFFTGKLRGYDSSTAEAYAKKYGCAFESLGAAPLPAVSLRGDLDLSGMVDVSDAVILARYLVGDDSFAVSDQGLANADADGSGKLTTDDVNYIVRMIVGLV